MTATPDDRGWRPLWDQPSVNPSMVSLVSTHLDSAQNDLNFSDRFRHAGTADAPALGLG